MAALTIVDLNTDCTLDRKGDVVHQGANCPWVFGIAVPFRGRPPRLPARLLTFTQQHHQQLSIYANQLINQSQTIDINYSGANSNISVVPVMVTTPQVG
jgi:hypothetical protein